MEHQKEHFRHILLFYFRKGKNASQAHKKLCAVYGDEALKERQNWFAKFRSDEERSGRPVEVDDDLIKAIIDSDRHSTTREIAEKLHVSHTCIENHLKQLGYVQKLDTWFFANKNQKFYERGIMMLPERWQKVIDKNGQYITE
ncbi:hypothetical protein COOONC_00245 [Cooperia oncophora]